MSATSTKSRRLVQSVGVALAMLTASCGFPAEDSPTAIEDDTATSSSTVGTGSVVATEEITVWFVRGDLLVSRARDAASPITAQAAIDALGAGCTPGETSSGLRSAIPTPAMLVTAELTRGIATVDLAPEFSDVAPGDQVLALGQVVYTLTDLPGVGRVRFQISGDAVSVPLPDGTSTDDSVSRDDFSSLTTAR